MPRPIASPDGMAYFCFDRQFAFSQFIKYVLNLVAVLRP